MFRVVVMLVAAVIGYKAWQLYGPPVDQLTSIAVRALDWAKSSLEPAGPSDTGTSTLAVDPRPVAPTFGGAAVGPSLDGGVMQAQSLVPASEFAAPPPSAQPSALAPPALASVASVGSTAKDRTPGAETELQTQYARIAELGAHDPQPTAWGVGGQLHRFSCRASLGGSPQFSRHFEAVAAEPRAAVEEVLAKLETWRASQAAAAQRGTTVR
jgi:hypothetical protein